MIKSVKALASIVSSHEPAVSDSDAYLLNFKIRLSSLCDTPFLHSSCRTSRTELI